MEEEFSYIRPPQRMVWDPRRGKQILRHPHTGGVVVAYRTLPTGEDGQWAAIGVAVSRPSNPSYDQKLIKRIARARLHDSPLRLQFAGRDDPLRLPVIRSALRTIIIEEPEWLYVDGQVLRPKRFTQRWGTELVGPDGSLLTAYFDFKHELRGVPREHAQVPRPLSHWILRLPNWILEVL